MTSQPVVCYLMGPTSAGKTELALTLHETLPVDIVSVDAAQVYRGMDIGTRKPTSAELARAPHRLIDICDPADSYSAARFVADAAREIDAIHACGRVPLLVGGTMFYFRALEYGLSHLPGANPAIRARLARAAADSGWPSLHARLTELDPAAADRIDPNDAQRIQRALEIIEQTGAAAPRPVATAPTKYRLCKLALWPDDRTVLHARIKTRFERMVERGLVAEVERLYGRGDLSLELPSMRTVGYRQVWHYLTGAINYNEMNETAIAATRQLAKRQLTWLRHYPDVRMFDCTGVMPVTAIKEAVARATA